MAKRRRPRQAGCDDIPVASFSDIAFLLIIFFILATTLVKTQGFLTELPSGQRSSEPPEKTTTIRLEGETLRINDEVVAMAELRKRLKGMKLAARTGDDRVVLFEAAGRVTYQQYFDIMAAVAKAGGIICIVRESEGEE